MDNVLKVVLRISVKTASWMPDYLFLIRVVGEITSAVFIKFDVS